MTKKMREFVTPFAYKYIDECMPDVYEVQSERRRTAMTTEAAAAAVVDSDDLDDAAYVDQDVSTDTKINRRDAKTEIDDEVRVLHYSIQFISHPSLTRTVTRLNITTGMAEDAQR